MKNRKSKKNTRNMQSSKGANVLMSEEKKSVGSRFTKEMEAACMSAPSKGTPDYGIEMAYLSVSVKN